MALRVPDAPPSPPELIAPSVERWRAMSPRQRERFLIDANSALQREAELAPPEGLPHSTSRSGSLTMLRDYFERVGRKIFLASDLAVHYPGERPFAPDILAVLDVEDKDDRDERLAWVVAEEGVGLDLALEILHNGDRRKDLFDNVLFYASLGITEYFVYDRRNQHLLGYRLPNPSATRYQPIPSKLGRLASEVLDLELGIVEGRLRFFHGEAQIPTTRELLTRINGLMGQVEARAEAEQARAEAEQARAETAVAGLRAALEAVLRLRGLIPTTSERALLSAQLDPARLSAWIHRAEHAATVAEVFEGAW